MALRSRREKKRQKTSVQIDHERRVIVVDGMEMDFDMLAAIVNPENRLLWAFLWNEGRTRIQALPFREDQVLWLEPSDLSYANEVTQEKRER